MCICYIYTYLRHMKYIYECHSYMYYIWRAYHINIYIYIYIYIYISASVMCICVCIYTRHMLCAYVYVDIQCIHTYTCAHDICRDRAAAAACMPTAITEYSL